MATIVPSGENAGRRVPQPGTAIVRSDRPVAASRIRIRRNRPRRCAGRRATAPHGRARCPRRRAGPAPARRSRCPRIGPRRRSLLRGRTAIRVSRSGRAQAGRQDPAPVGRHRHEARAGIRPHPARCRAPGRSASAASRPPGARRRSRLAIGPAPATSRVPSGVNARLMDVRVAIEEVPLGRFETGSAVRSSAGLPATPASLSTRRTRHDAVVAAAGDQAAVGRERHGVDGPLVEPRRDRAADRRPGPIARRDPPARPRPASCHRARRPGRRRRRPSGSGGVIRPTCRPGPHVEQRDLRGSDWSPSAAAISRPSGENAMSVIDRASAGRPCRSGPAHAGAGGLDRCPRPATGLPPWPRRSGRRHGRPAMPRSPLDPINVLRRMSSSFRRRRTADGPS